MLGCDNALALDMSDASPGLYSNAHKFQEQAVAEHLAWRVQFDQEQGLQ